MRPKDGDDTIKTLVTMFESKADCLSLLAAEREWLTSYYLDKLLEGDREVHAEFFNKASP